MGDAAGRVSKNDHSSADRKFAQSVGIIFKTPEEFFLHEEADHNVVTDDEEHHVARKSKTNGTMKTSIKRMR